MMKLYELKLARLNGAVIQFYGADEWWHITENPQWDDCTEYRIGETMKHDLYRAEVASLERLNTSNVEWVEIGINLAIIFGLILLAGYFS